MWKTGELVERMGGLFWPGASNVHCHEHECG
jgi:hypothetical protein